MQFKTAYSKKTRQFMPSMDKHGEPLPSMTQQCHKDECDIHRILRNHDKTGLITHINTATLQYGDYSEINEFQVNMNMIINAENAFGELPSEIRKRFQNNAGEFFEFATNPKNKEELIRLGLANKPLIPTEPKTAPKIVPEPLKTGE